MAGLCYISETDFSKGVSQVKRDDANEVGGHDNILFPRRAGGVLQ